MQTVEREHRSHYRGFCSHCQCALFLTYSLLFLVSVLTKSKTIANAYRRLSIIQVSESQLSCTSERESGLFSTASSTTVADPSTVTVRIEGASTSDLNVQDVVSTSSSSSSLSDDGRDKHQHQQNNHRPSYHASTATNRSQTPTVVTHDKLSARSSIDTTSSSRTGSSRPNTAASLPAKTSASANEWDLECQKRLASSAPRRNPSCPSISPNNVRVKSSSMLLHQQVPSVFTTTSECLGKDLRPQPRRDPPRRSQSLVKQSTITGNPASPTIPIVFLTDDILLGSIRALQNERQLCKLFVDYLIDATNMRPDELARKANVGARLPCQCGHTHSRCTLTLEFDPPFLPTAAVADQTNLSSSKIRDLARTQLEQLFSAVNRFIYKAQQESKRILIYGFELTQNSPLAVIAIQYLMLNNEQLSLSEATHRIHRLFPVLPIQQQQYPILEKRFQDYLKQLDRKNFPRNFIVNSISADGSSSSGGANEYRQSTREISWDSPETVTTTITTTTASTSWTTSPMPFDHSLFPARSAWDI